MRFFRNIISRFSAPTESDDRESRSLVHELEASFDMTIREFSSPLEPARNQVAKAELAAFAYYCVWDWNRRQSEFDKDYDIALGLLRYQAAESATLMNFPVTDAEQFGLRHDSEAFIEDRLRIYDLVETNPADSDVTRGARLYRTLAKLTSIGCGRCRLEVQPGITDMGELELRARIAKLDRKEDTEAHMAVWGSEVRLRSIPQVIEVLRALYQLRADNLK